MPQMTIGRKIWCACAAMAALTAVLGGTAIVNVSRLHSAARLIADDALPSTSSGGPAEHGSEGDPDPNEPAHAVQPTERQAQYQSYLSERVKQWRQEVKSCEGYANTDKHVSIASAKTDFEMLLQAWQRILPLSAAQQHQEAFAIYERDAMSVAEHLDETMKSLVSLNRELGDQASASVAKTAAASKTWTVLILMAALLAGGSLVFVIVRGVNRTLRRAVKVLAESSRQVASAASQIANTSQALAQGASEQAASLEETSASSEQINAMARNNADHSRSAVELVAQSQTGFVQANRSLGEMVQAMVRDQRLQRQNLKNHKGDRRNRVSDQHSGVECGSGGGSRRRSGDGICGGG